MTNGMARPRALAVALIAVALLVGLVGGVALDRWVLRPASASAGEPLWAGPAGPGGPGGPGGPPLGERAGRFRARYLQQLARTLDLTPAQRTQVDSLLRAQQLRTRALMRRNAPEMQAITTETNDALRAILTPEQWRRFEQLRHDRLERRRGEHRRPRTERESAGH